MIGFPQTLIMALEDLLAGESATQLARDAQNISENYRLRTGQGNRLLTLDREAVAYAASRMPATYAAAQEALMEAVRTSGCQPETLLDCGAGTGAASWAAAWILPLKQITCMEREAAMRHVGSTLMHAGEGALAEAIWQDGDMTADMELPKAELVMEGYMLGELREDQRVRVARKLWQACTKMLVLIEPGTPQGFANLRAVREALTQDGAYVAAPCPQTGKCPMADGDWCHFTVRVQRTRLHKQLKGGEAPFEDEKYSYLVLTREKPQENASARVLRHPQIAPGRIVLTLCEEGGKKTRVVTKKDPLWKRVRKIEAGDAL